MTNEKLEAAFKFLKKVEPHHSAELVGSFVVFKPCLPAELIMESLQFKDELAIALKKGTKQ